MKDHSLKLYAYVMLVYGKFYTRIWNNNDNSFKKHERVQYSFQNICDCKPYKSIVHLAHMD